MLERYFLKPETVDRIRGSWGGKAIEQYVTWLAEKNYASRTITRRVPLLMNFLEFAKEQGADAHEHLPSHIDSFVQHWIVTRGNQPPEGRRKIPDKEIRGPIEQMLTCVLPDFVSHGRRKKPDSPFDDVPAYISFLRDECGLKPATIRHHSFHLREFAKYLKSIDLHTLKDLSPPVVSGFFIQLQPHASLSSLRGAAGVLRVLLRYAFREKILNKDLSGSVEFPTTYRLSRVPRSISWDEVRCMLESVERRTSIGKRDYAILLLLVTYGLRAREVASMTIDHIDWRAERLHVPERKADHSTAYPLSTIVGDAVLDYLQKGRPETNDRHIFFRAVAPYLPLTYSAVSGCASRYLRKAGIAVQRPGSHTLRHTCVQRLVDAQFSLKMIGDYVGHRSPASTEIYTKVDIETLREVAMGDGEEVLR